MNDKTYDVIIIGGGPAGFTAAIYTAREKWETILLDKSMTGGIPNNTTLIENYPGFPEGISGLELMSKFRQQAERFGTTIREYEEVLKIHPADKYHIVTTEKSTYRAKAVIIATGGVPRMLDVPGEKEYAGRGVSYCATCDGPLFKDKDVAVIGCGNSGLQEGETLLRYVKSVTFIEFLPYMTAQKILQERIQTNKKARFLLNCQLTSINGKELVSSLRIRNRNSQKEEDIPIEGIFIYAGYLPNSGFLKGVVNLDKYGYVITNERMQTSLKGVYAAGDVRSKKYRQIAEAIGDATVGALAISEYLSEI